MAGQEASSSNVGGRLSSSIPTLNGDTTTTTSTSGSFTPVAGAMLQQPSQVAPGSAVGVSAFSSMVSLGPQQLPHVAPGSAVAGSAISSMTSLGSNAQSTTSISIESCTHNCSFLEVLPPACVNLGVTKHL